MSRLQLTICNGPAALVIAVATGCLASCMSALEAYAEAEFARDVDASLARAMDSVEENIPSRVRAREYAAAEERLRHYQTRYEADHANEPHLRSVLAVISDTPDPRLESMYCEWVEQYPDSFAPYFARGIFYEARAWEERGGLAAEDTSPRQFEAMRSRLEQAREDLLRAIDLHPGLVHAYVYLIAGAMAFSDDDQVPEVYENKALSIAPESAAIREACFHAMEPRWGGTFEDMEAFLEDTLKYVETNPELRVLRGRVIYERGEMLWRFTDSPDYQEALGYYDRALADGERWYYRLGRGYVLAYLGRNREAIADFQRAIRQRPSYRLSHEALVLARYREVAP